MIDGIGLVSYLPHQTTRYHEKVEYSVELQHPILFIASQPYTQGRYWLLCALLAMRHDWQTIDRDSLCSLSRTCSAHMAFLREHFREQLLHKGHLVHPTGRIIIRTRYQLHAAGTCSHCSSSCDVCTNTFAGPRTPQPSF